MRGARVFDHADLVDADHAVRIAEAQMSDRPIRVTLSQDIDPASVRLGDTCGSGSFRVERVAVDGDGSPVASPDGDIRQRPDGVILTPAAVNHQETLSIKSN